MYKLYGIANCDTVKKARMYLEEQQIKFEFVDFKKYRPTKEDIERWSKSFGDLPVNKKGITYKKHKDNYEKLGAEDKITFLQDNTSMIKRPILENKSTILAFGFEFDTYFQVLKIR